MNKNNIKFNPLIPYNIYIYYTEFLCNKNGKIKNKEDKQYILPVNYVVNFYFLKRRL